MSNQFTLSVKDSLKKLQKELSSLAPAMESQIAGAIKDASYAAYAAIMAKAQAKLSSRRQDYLAGLSITELDENSYLIELDGKGPNALEDGFASFNMVPGLLASKKMVEVGSRAGQPWVQTSKPQGKNNETHKFAHVPLQMNPFSQAPKSADMAAALRAITAQSVHGQYKSLTSIFKDPHTGQAIEGKTAVGISKDPTLNGIVKYQKVHTRDNGKQNVQSIYIKYRTVSENGDPWMHPGFSGLHAFEEAERDLVKNLDQILKKILEE